MRKLKGFTLVELLVVVSIIAILLAILIPSLQKARETAKRIMCSNHLKTFGMSNVAYSVSCNGAYVPVRSTAGAWLQNKTFRNLLEIDKYLKKDDLKFNGDTIPFDLPDAYMCPSDIISHKKSNRFKDPQLGGGEVLLSYGYNFTEWSIIGEWTNWNGKPSDAGHKASNVKQPGTKLAFIDAIDWWVTWRWADYVNAWDIVGQANIDDYRKNPPYENSKANLLPDPVFGPVIYRHSEGANIGFYDGHVKFMRKQEIFVMADREIITIGTQRTRKNTGMWVSDPTMYIKNGAP
ncbi:MAG: putative major pilin subunit [Planctomycetes bacterium ADurb.Bin401]|nr:MAG: putative major pilin subunit [Planctomycetes bacterium ADurb.Bin401]